ncbi:hypothetical protein PA598K_06064 [Paenibacillus sp. 598K]|uniref:glycosyltransferase n=1 Tax=Paenibacillus sp. 598K TaxID=1117987 RepID=UPI000FFA8D5F|nr:glycosyltransferase [Paenibacillus sp. 598K]GBF77510.1 hypothetical protein PA598K_06064 [Paenibacillus sp. 598K]
MTRKKRKTSGARRRVYRIARKKFRRSGVIVARRKSRSSVGNRAEGIRRNAFQTGRHEGFERGRRDGYALGLERGRAAAAAQPPAPTPSLLPPVDALVVSAGYIASMDIIIIQPFEALRRRGGFSYAIHEEGTVTREMIAAAHTIVFVRNVEPAALELLKVAHELGKRTIYVIDDNFLEIPPTSEVGRYYRDPERQEACRQFLTLAHIVKVDAPELGSYIEAVFNRPTMYFSASVDFEWLDGVERLPRQSGPLVIGYEGTSKEEEFAAVVPALRRILRYYGGFVSFEFIGYMPPGLEGLPNITYTEGGVDYRTFIRSLKQRAWDIGIAPLSTTLFNNGKTNNKLREYSACGIPGIYSDSPVYRPWVTHGENGYLVPHTEEGWYAGLCTMIDNPDLREQIRIQAETKARELFSLDNCADAWREHIFGH